MSKVKSLFLHNRNTDTPYSSGISTVVWGVLALMLAMMMVSARGDSAIMDELAHIPAGFGYVVEHDTRLNPEHPPLLKALAAFSGELFVHPYFPTTTTAWQDDVNGQWTQGDIFLYGVGNNADKIIFWSRFPLILMTVFFAGLFFYWVRRRWGDKTAFLSLLLFAFSPTFLTHGRFVTTDVGASLGFFIGIASFVSFLENPSRRQIIYFGFCTGIALLLKFSLVLLLPMYAVILFAWCWAMPDVFGKRVKTFLALIGKSILAGIISIALIWFVYFLVGYNLPQARQFRDTEAILASHPSKLLVRAELALVKYDFTRPLGQYVLGVLMVGQRAEGGNMGFFRGEISNQGWKSYFPLLYLYKEPLALHLLTLLALGIGISKIRRSTNAKKYRFFASLRSWVYSHVAEFSAVVVIVVYWVFSIISPLNIGVRHVLPTFPFIYLLVSRQIAGWLEIRGRLPRDLTQILQGLWRLIGATFVKYTAVIFLFGWLIIGTLRVFPNFLSYYNELGGGPSRGYNIAVDSNYDWGQDLIRLKNFTEENNIDRIYLDYFGGGNPSYYLGDKFIPWNSPKGKVSGWYAISATFRQNSLGRLIPSLQRNEEDDYAWLKPYEPVARAGESIFIYRLP